MKTTVQGRSTAVQGAMIWSALLCAAIWSAATTAAAPEATTPRVLFIGNSLTTVNDVPGLVERLAIASGRSFRYRVVAFDGYSLEDHWNRGDARRAIAEGGWSAIVLQQGPSALPASRALLVAYARRFATEAEGVGAQTALYMVWPAANRTADFEAVRGSYAAAAREVHGRLLPVGEAWRSAWRRDPRLDLYGSDGFHPTPAGSYLAALVVFQAFFEQSAIGAPPLVVPADRARVLQEAANDAMARYGGTTVSPKR